MSVLSDLRQFFLPDPSPKRMEKRPPPPKRPKRPPRYAFKKRPGGLTKFAIDTAHLPVSVAEQIELDIRSALAFRYTGREDYRKPYLEAGVPVEDIPEEEMEELPGAEGIKIPILGWEIPSEQAWKVAKSWWKSVVNSSDISLAVEGDFVWKPLLANWGIENLRVVEEVVDPKTGKTKKGKFILGKESEELSLEEKERRLGKVRPELLQERPDVDYESVWYRIQEKLGKQLEDALTEEDERQREKKIGKVWDTLQNWVEQGQTFGMSEEGIQSFGIAEEEIRVLETIRQIKDEYPLTGAILDWLKYGETRPDRLARFPRVKEEWLKAVQPQLSKDESSMAWAVLRNRIQDTLVESDPDIKKKAINELWRDFISWAKQGYTFGISEPSLNVLKVVEYRGLQFEAHDFLDLRENDLLFRSYIWAGFLRPEIERRTAKYLVAHPQVKQFLRQAFSPILSRDLTNDLLARGRLLPNRLIYYFLRRVFKQRFPKEVLVRLKGELAPDLFRQIRGNTLADLGSVLPAKAYNQLKNSLYVKWRGWFLPGRFLEWVGRNLTKIQQRVFGWIEGQMIKETWLGRRFKGLAFGVARRGAFVEQALSQRPLTKVPAVAAARRAVAGAALRLRRMPVFKKVARKLAQLLVKTVQGATKLTGPVGAAITTAVTFFGGRIVAKLWEKGKPVAKGAVVAGCGCFSAMVMFPFFLLVFIIAPAFQGEGMGGMGPGEQLVEVRKVASPRSIDKDATGADAEVTYTIEVTNRTDKEITEGTLTDLYDARDFLPSILGGANEHIHNEDTGEGRLSWLHVTVPPNGNFSVTLKGFIQRAGEERIVVNNVGFTGDLEGESISDNALAGVIVGDPEGQPPSGWPTESGCITQGPNTSGQEASHQGQEAIDIGGAIGTPVYATHDGLAWSYTDTGTNAGGNYIYVISQPGGFYTLYAHLEPFMEEFLPDRCPVPVVAGQQIGEMGNSGHSTGPHLHYEFLYDYLGEELKMGPPYIPSAINSCIGGIECNCCFSGFNGVCDD